MPATPVPAPNVRRSSVGTRVKAQLSSTKARWMIVGVTKMRLVSSLPLIMPLAIETTTNIEPISVPAAAPSTMKKSCHLSSISIAVSHPPGTLRLAAIGGALRGDERVAALALHQILDRPRRRRARIAALAATRRFGAPALLHRLDPRRIFEAVPHDQNHDREHQQLGETQTEHYALIPQL